MYTCIKCGSEKSENAFPIKKKRGKNFRSGQCSDCQRAYQSQWQKTHRDKVNQYKKTYRDTHLDQVHTSKRAYYRKDPELSRARNRDYWARNKDKQTKYNESYANQRRWGYILRTHGITADQWHAMYARQNGHCAICLRDLPLEQKLRRELQDGEVLVHVDHDHDTDEVRGLLCGTCNQGIGMLKDDPQVLKRAILYLTDGHPRFASNRPHNAPSAAKTHCPQGHPYSGDNLIVRTNGSRRCRICQRAQRESIYAKGRTCIDCGAHISVNGLRCRACSGIARRGSRS